MKTLAETILVFIERNRLKGVGSECDANTCKCNPHEWGNMDDMAEHHCNMYTNMLLNELKELVDNHMNGA